jgi:hemerythrin-like domain-containing protein
MYFRYIINDMPIQIGQPPDHGFDEPLRLLSDCHRRIEHFLHVLIAIHERAAGGSLTPVERADLEASVTYFATAAPKHIADEEQSLFPRLRASGDTATARALDMIARLERDHDEADQHHGVVDTLVRRWLVCGHLETNEARELREHLTALRVIYEPHIEMEDRELFPTAARLLSASEIHEMGREMAARRRPPAKTRSQSDEGTDT